MYIRFLISVEDSGIRKEIEKINKRYFSDELSTRFMVSLAESGIQQATGGSAVPAADDDQQLITGPEDKKAIEILKWMVDQRDIRNALYYTNEFARRLMLQERIKGVMSLMRQFQSSMDDATTDEILAYWEERQKIDRLASILSSASSLGLCVESDLEYYAMEESIRKQSRIQIDARN